MSIKYSRLLFQGGVFCLYYLWKLPCGWACPCIMFSSKSEISSIFVNLDFRNFFRNGAHFGFHDINYKKKKNWSAFAWGNIYFCLHFSVKSNVRDPWTCFSTVCPLIWHSKPLSSCYSAYRIYSIYCPGRLLNFWTLRVGAYSRLGAY